MSQAPRRLNSTTHTSSLARDFLRDSNSSTAVFISPKHHITFSSSLSGSSNSVSGSPALFHMRLRTLSVFTLVIPSHER